MWVTGNIYGHPAFPDGKFVHTSRVVGLDLDTRTLSTLNSTYHLGKPAAAYAEQFPQSMEVVK